MKNPFLNSAADAQETKRPTWERTRKRHLLRHKSGRYYARAFAGGKEVWKSLDTSHFSIAEHRLRKFLNVDVESRRNGSNSNASPKMTFSNAATVYSQNLDDKLAARQIKPRTGDYWRECLASLQRNWPHVSETQLRKISPADCRAWANAYVKKASPTRYNNTLSVLRQVLDVGVQAGVIYSNPAADLKRVAVRGKEIALPSVDKFNALIAEMRAGHSRDSVNCADLGSGLAFTGCRIGEAREIAWRDIDFAAREIVVRGDSNTGTKNRSVRRVPLIPDARVLFEQMRSDRPSEPLDAKVFCVGECQKALDRACKKVGTDRITHHDLRHLFATRCIESGVDIPTVSRWLGHKDGGALAMKTYGHLRREHSIAQAQRVTFTPVATKQADVIAFPTTA
jgi:integrase